MLPKEAKLIIDLTLGDGYIGGNNSKGYFFQCNHSIKQKAYAMHKASLFRDFGLHAHEKEEYRENSYGKYFFGFRVYTQFAKTARKYLYNQRVKRIDRALLSVLDRKSLAYWFMDNGCVDKCDTFRRHNGKRYQYEIPFARAYRIATHAHTKEELDVLCAWFYEKYAIVAKPTIVSSLRRSQFNISITLQKSKDIFISLIQEYVIPEMHYKIMHPHSLRGIPYTLLEP